MARPKKLARDRLDGELRIRMTSADRSAINRASKKELLEASTWARRLLVRWATEINKPKKVIDQRPKADIMNSAGQEPAAKPTPAHALS